MVLRESSGATWAKAGNEKEEGTRATPASSTATPHPQGGEYTPPLSDGLASWWWEEVTTPTDHDDDAERSSPSRPTQDDLSKAAWGRRQFLLREGEASGTKASGQGELDRGSAE